MSEETCCLRAHEMVTGRQGAYGDMGKSWQEIGAVADLITGPEDDPGVRACKVLIAMKLIRMKNSPENQDHYDDLAGYAEVLWRTSRVHGTSRVHETPEGVYADRDLIPCPGCGRNRHRSATGARCPNCSANHPLGGGA